MRFLDGTKVMVNGLTEILAECYSEGREATPETGKRILERLEAARNHVPPSEFVRREYAHVLLEEYRTYAAEQANSGREPG